MATKIKPATKSVYEQDFYVWTEVQAELLRQRRFDELDLANLIEEVEGSGDTKKSAVLSNATVVIEHLPKLEHSPATDPRPGCIDSILEDRSRLEYELTPRLRQILQDQRPRVYGVARRTADRRLRVHGGNAAADRLPAACPYSVDQIIDDWWP